MNIISLPGYSAMHATPAPSQVREVSGQVIAPNSSTLQQLEARYQQILRLRQKWAHHPIANEMAPKSTAP